MADRIGVIYCGSCGALNPRANHFCSACGHQLVDAYHASEGLRVYATPDPGAPLVEIVNPGADITVVATVELLPADFAKVTLEDGRVGYVRLREVEDVVSDAETQREPVGCVSSTAVLAVVALLVVSAALVLVTAMRSGDSGGDVIAFLACGALVLLLLMVVGLYLFVRKREDEILHGDEDEDRTEQPVGERAHDPASG